jgi:hypothetical protein
VGHDTDGSIVAAERRAATVVWLVVNAVNLLQALGFATRPFAPWANPALGVVIALLAVPATYALFVFVRSGSGRLALAGPLMFDVFVVFMLGVDYVARLEWRDPVVAVVEIPYLALFFGSILLMGLPMYRRDRGLWRVTAATTALLLVAMLFAMWRGVG